MHRIIIAAATLALAATTASAQTPAKPAAAPAAGAYSTANSEIGALLDNPATKAVLDKHLPEFSANPQVDMARSMTLKQIQSYSADTITDAALAKIDADLAKVPAAK